jgi:hypothetical protein
MKLVAVTLLALVAAVYAGPISVSDNNVGDIVTVDVNANLDISNQVELNLISIIALLLSQQIQTLPVVTGGTEKAAELPKFKITPETLENVKKMFNKQ